MKKWLKETGIKIIKTMAETALGVIGTTALITDVNWAVVGSSALLSGIVCVLMNISAIEPKEGE